MRLSKKEIKNLHRISDALKDWEEIRIPADVKRKANAICRKYSGWKMPNEIPRLWDELEALGIEVGMIAGSPDSRAPGSKSWTKEYEWNGKRVTNSRLIYSIYEGSNGPKDEYLIYLS